MVLSSSSKASTILQPESFTISFNLRVNCLNRFESEDRIYTYNELCKSQSVLLCYSEYYMHLLFLCLCCGRCYLTIWFPLEIAIFVVVVERIVPVHRQIFSPVIYLLNINRVKNFIQTIFFEFHSLYLSQPQEQPP